VNENSVISNTLYSRKKSEIEDIALTTENFNHNQHKCFGLFKTKLKNLIRKKNQKDKYKNIKLYCKNYCK
jgi:hypothetical protein